MVLWHNAVEDEFGNPLVTRFTHGCIAVRDARGRHSFESLFAATFSGMLQLYSGKGRDDGYSHPLLLQRLSSVLVGNTPL